MRVPFRSAVLLGVAAVALAAAPATVVAAPPHVAKKKKKKKKPAPLTATVSGTFSIREEIEGGFGNDKGPNWQELSVEVKKAEIPFTVTNYNAAVKATVTFHYHAEARTEDRSYHLGCDSEYRETDGTWTGKTSVGAKETKWLQTNGKSKAYSGWTVYVEPPDSIPLTTKGAYNDWESILMTNCLTYDITQPLGGWSAGFARPDGVGKLADDNRSVPLLSINTGFGQTGKASGSIRFNKKPR